MIDEIVFAFCIFVGIVGGTFVAGYAPKPKPKRGEERRGLVVGYKPLPQTPPPPARHKRDV